MILAAFSLAFAAQPVVETVQPPLPAPGRTTLEISRDPLDDSVRAFVVFRAGRAQLSVGCNRDQFGGVRVGLTDNAWFTGRTIVGQRPVRVRFDRHRAWSTRWDVDDGMLSLRGREPVTNFIGWMLLSERIAMRTTDVEDRRLDYVFDLRESRAAIEQMLTACGATAIHRSLADLGLLSQAPPAE